MQVRKFLRPTNNRLRLVMGLGLLGLVCVQCARPSVAFRETAQVPPRVERPGQSQDPRTQRLEMLARTDPIGLLKLCLQDYDATIRDYRCTLIKQERINGTVTPEQEVQVKFLDKPFSVAMQWVRNAPIGDRALYIEGQHNGNMLVRPKGMLGKLVGTVERKPDGPEAMANTLRPINLFGFKRSLQSLLEVYELAAGRGDLKSEFLGYQDAAGRQTMVLERTLPAREGYPAYRTRIFIDPQWLVPIQVEAWDWNDQIESRYTFKDVELNVGLTDADFTPQANGL